MKSLLACLALGVSASAATINSGTAAWEVSSTGATGTFSAAVIEINTPIFPGGWIDPSPAQWIGTTANDAQFVTGALPGTYVFRLALGVIQGGAGIVNFQYAGDNSVMLWIGNSAGVQSATVATCDTAGDASDCYTSLRTASASFGATDYLYATVVNGDINTTNRNPMGFLAIGATTDPAPIPEPSTYAMLALGGVAIGLARLRRK
jgi:hypothetical protein